MLDTNISDSVIKQNNDNVINKLKAVAKKKDDICISSIVASELMYGVEKSQSTKLRQIVNHFISNCLVMELTEADARVYGALRAKMKKKGDCLGNLDMLIVAHALARNCTLISNDAAIKRFGASYGYQVEDWKLVT